MAHDVFISYSNEDKNIADAVCDNLERKGMRCWIAPRDVIPGVNYGESILDAIKEAEVLVLILSAYSNQSAYVMREVERAVNSGINIIPFRVEDVVPSKQLEFFISTAQWQDALTPPLEAHINSLAQTVGNLLNKPTPNLGVQNYVKPQSGTRRNIPPNQGISKRPQRSDMPKKSSNRGLLIGGAIGAILLLCILIAYGSTAFASNNIYTGNGISFDYNKSWEQNNTLPLDGIAEVYDPSSDSYGHYTAIVCVYKDKSSDNLADYINSHYNGLSEDISSLQWSYNSEVYIDGVKSLRYDYKYTYGGTYVGSDYWFNKEGYIYDISCEAPSNEYNSQEDDFNVIVNSFSFT